MARGCGAASWPRRPGSTTSARPSSSSTSRPTWRRPSPGCGPRRAGAPGAPGQGGAPRVVVPSDQSARLEELLAEQDVVAAAVARLAEPPPAGAVALVQRSLNGGFAGGPEGLVLVTDKELVGTGPIRRPRALRRVVPRD